MMDDRNNRERIFKDLVGVSTYYEKFINKKSDLLLYISFNEATFGGNPNDKISFTLKLSAAEFFIVIEDKTLKIDPSSIWIPRTNVENDMEQTEVRTHEVNVGASADLFGGAGAKAGYTHKKETATKQNHKMGGIKVVYHPMSKNKCCWILKPYLDGDVLEGGAWDDRKKLLTLVDQRTDTKHVLSSVKLIVQCKRKDLEISPPAFLEKNILEKHTLEKLQTKKKDKIAIEMIKKALMGYELIGKKSDISRDHAIIPLADILVEIE